MDRSFVVHVGTHKTGTSIIQRFFSSNRVILARQGVNFLRLPSAARKQLSNASLSDEAAAESFANSLRFAIKRAQVTIGPARQNRCCLISWEGFCGDALNGYSNAPILARRLRIALAGQKAKIILYIRRQDDFLESMYSQFIRQAKDFSFSSYLEEARPGVGFDWSRLCSAFAQEFGKDSLAVRRYQRSSLPEKDSILRDFCSILGMSFNHFQIPDNFFSRQNQGWNRSVVEFARLAYSGLTQIERKRLSHLLDQNITKAEFEQYSYFTTFQRKQFLSSYDASNRNVAIEYFPHDSPELFDAPAEKAELIQPWNGLKAEDIIPIMAQVVLKHADQSSDFLASIRRLKTALSRRVSYLIG